MCPVAASPVEGGGDEGDPAGGVAAERSSATGDTGRGDASDWAETGDEGDPGGDGGPKDAAGDLMTTKVGEAGWADPGKAGDTAGDPIVPTVAPAGEADEAASGGVECMSGPCTSIALVDTGAVTGSWEEIGVVYAENKSGDR